MELLQRLYGKIKKKWPHLTKKYCFIQYIAPVHTSVIAVTKINELMFEFYPHVDFFSIRFTKLSRSPLKGVLIFLILMELCDLIKWKRWSSTQNKLCIVQEYG